MNRASASGIRQQEDRRRPINFWGQTSDRRRQMQLSGRLHEILIDCRTFPPNSSPYRIHSFSLCASWSVHSIITARLTVSNSSQAHRIITQVVFTGARVFGRAFAEAYRQASASQVRAIRLEVSRIYWSPNQSSRNSPPLRKRTAVPAPSPPPA